MLEFLDNFNLSRGGDTEPFLKNSAYKGFQKERVENCSQGFDLKQFKQGHCQDFTDEPKLIGFESLKRESMQLVMIDQFFETSFNALPFMIKLIELDRGQLQVTGNGVIIGPNFPFSGFAVFSPTDPPDNDHSGLHAID